MPNAFHGTTLVSGGSTRRLKQHVPPKELRLHCMGVGTLHSASHIWPLDRPQGRARCPVVTVMIQGYQSRERQVCWKSNSPLKEGRASQGESTHFSTKEAVVGPGGSRDPSETHSPQRTTGHRCLPSTLPLPTMCSGLNWTL